jgi:hypothetical protein
MTAEEKDQAPNVKEMTEEKDLAVGKIIRLEGENVKRIVAVDITPDGFVNIIGGENAQGKTSVLDCIEYALGGLKTVPSEPIHRGADKATIRLKIHIPGGDLIVTRTFTSKGSYLKVENADGSSYKSPQAILDKLVGSLSFDPLAFKTMPPREQYETLKAVTGLDFSELERQREDVYQHRTEINRELERTKGAIAEYPDLTDAPKEPVALQALLSELKEAQEHNAEVRRLGDEWEDRKSAILNVEKRQAEIEEEIMELEKVRNDLIKQKTALEDSGELIRQRAEEAVEGATSEIEQKIANSERHNDAYKMAQELAKLRERKGRLEDGARAATRNIENIDQEKRERMAKTELPVPGLGFGAGTVTYNGLPLDQASTAEAIEVSIAMGSALNPKLRVMLIRAGEKMSPATLERVRAYAKEKNLQLWIEDCRAGDKATVIIEDGKVKK